MVANHAGAIPVDAPSIMHGIERDLHRPVYGLADEVFKRIPLVNLGWSRLGGVQAHPDNAYRLLREQQQLVMVFPEGSKGPGKLYSERYQLRRFGRGGFVQIAMRAGVPIIPLAIVGNEETMPIVTKIPALARALGVPYAPITANMLALGPLGALVPFPAKLRIRVLDPVVLDVPPDQPRYSRSRIMDTSEDIRHAIQAELHDMLRHRQQRVVRLMGRRVLVTGLGSFWGGRVAQALEEDPDVDVIIGLDTREPSVPLDRTEYVRVDESYSILSRIVRATQVDTIVHTFLVVDSNQVPAPPDARDQRHRHDEPVRGRQPAREPGPQRGGEVVDPGLRRRPTPTRCGSARTPAGRRSPASGSSGRCWRSRATSATTPPTTPT